MTLDQKKINKSSKLLTGKITDNNSIILIALDQKISLKFET